MEPLLINEQFVIRFRYWREGQVRTGMRFRKGLFECVFQFEPSQRHQAFDLAWNLKAADREVVVTVSTEQYTVWTELHVTPATSAVPQPDRTCLVQATEVSHDKVRLSQSVLSV